MSTKIITINRKAGFEYHLTDKYEAGIVLTGSEVKSLRINTASIKESYIAEKNGELWLINCNIKKYFSSSVILHSHNLMNSFLKLYYYQT